MSNKYYSSMYKNNVIIAYKKEKLYKALSLCSNPFNQALYTYFSETALKNTILLHLLMNSINEMKKNIYRDYIELGKQEKFTNPSISTSTFTIPLFHSRSIG